jgi:AcrR family transcriptional regulator
MIDNHKSLIYQMMRRGDMPLSEIAKRLGVNVTTVWRWARDAEIDVEAALQQAYDRRWDEAMNRGLGRKRKQALANEADVEFGLSNQRSVRSANGKPDDSLLRRGDGEPGVSLRSLRFDPYSI